MPVAMGVFAPTTSSGSLKRKASDSIESSEQQEMSPAKRPREEYRVATPPETPPASSHPDSRAPSYSFPVEDKSFIDVDRVADIANEHFGREILLRHQELRFINQELAKCQAALEQLRRCHLIPYPSTCPTPQQMLDIVDLKVPAVENQPGVGPVPQWAPPYGIVDGPYARHYAKWLIPDPRFDGQTPECVPVAEATRSAEGRSTRNSLSLPEGSSLGRRGARGQSSQRLANATPATPKVRRRCIMTRSDGVLVRLECFACHRDEFANVQGFINHVRIAERVVYSSHQEAAEKCGHPIDESELAAYEREEIKAQETKASAVPPVVTQESQMPSAAVHPLTVADPHAAAGLDQNFSALLKKFPQGRMPRVARSSDDVLKPAYAGVAGVDSQPANSFVGSSATPSLSMLLQQRGFDGDLSARVDDARTKMALDELVSEDESDDESEEFEAMVGERAKLGTMAGVRLLIPAMRLPAHLSLDPTASNLSSMTTPVNDEDASSVIDLNMMDSEHSPNTATSNNAPSLMSDDGGDDSDDGGSSSDASDADAVEEDIAEVNPEYDDDHLVQHTAGTNSASRNKDASKHVTFVASVPENPKSGARRKPNV